MTPSSKPKTPPSDNTSTDSPLSFEKVWLMFQETEIKYKETDRMLSEKFKETDITLKQQKYLFISEWGNLVESLFDGDIVTLLNQRGINVIDIIEGRKGRRDGINFEFDIITINNTEMVIVEVKTTLTPEDIRLFLKKLAQAKDWMPEYADKIVYGAVAFISEDTGSSAMAEKNGLFVIKATGDSASIVNADNFVPKSW
ncbi:MAG: hypothetical protein GX268_07330 [Methanomicrobiales archaeon]|jgi:hypothetical protein|nr:hypothetical protein [Methanomicrobiales archaeon]